MMKRREKSEISAAKASRAAVQQKGPARQAPPTAMPFDQLLERLHRAVDQQYRHSPHLAAFEAIRFDDPEQVDLFSARAADLFSEILREEPQDPLALHHLAVIHHGNGYRLHLDHPGSARDALPHWKKGVQAWARLVSRDGFWDGLRARWQTQQEKDGNDMLIQRLLQVDLDRFRRHLPKYILKLHAALVHEFLDHEPSIARAHLEIILDSGFDAETVDQVRKSLFHDVVGDTEEACQLLRYDEVRRELERYLQFDPAYPGALRAAVHVCNAECEQLGTDQQSYQTRLSRLTACRERAAAPELVQLAEREQELLISGTLSEFHYHWVRAEIDQAQALGKEQMGERNACFQRALPHAQQAVAWERCATRAHQIFRKLCFHAAITNLAGEKVDLGAARRFLDVWHERMPRDPCRAAWSALLAYRREDMHGFQTELERAIQYNQAASDSEAADLIAQLQQLSRSGAATSRIGRLLDQASEAMQSQSFRRALGFWDQLVEHLHELPEDVVVLVYAQQAQCRYLTEDVHGARVSYHQARRHAGGNVDGNLRNLLDSLGKVLE